MTYEISVHSRRIGDMLHHYGDGMLNVSAIERACRCGYLKLGEVDLELMPVLRGLVAARVEYYRLLILAGHRIEPILVTDGPCILDGFHRAQAHREAGRRYASCWMIPAAELELFKLPKLRTSGSGSADGLEMGHFDSNAGMAREPILTSLTGGKAARILLPFDRTGVSGVGARKLDMLEAAPGRAVGLGLAMFLPGQIVEGPSRIGD
jgi:hypothetical protein